MNRAGLSMMGLSDEDEIRGQPYLDAVGERDRERIGELLAAAINGTSSAFEFETTGGRHFRSSFVPIRDRHGKVARLMGLTADITNRKRAEAKAREYRDRLRTLTAELSTAEERQRRQIASELHDGISQTLAAARIKVSEALRGSEASSAEALHQVLRLLDDAVRQTRSLTHEISPRVLYDLGFEAAVQWLAEEFSRHHDLEISFVSEPGPKPLGESLSVFLFKAVRELLINVVKHARARTVEVTLERREGMLVVTVRDDGGGFAVDERLYSRSGSDGFGLFNIRDRLDYYGGSCEVTSTRGAGTSVVMSAPLEFVASPSG